MLNAQEPRSLFEPAPKKHRQLQLATLQIQAGPCSAFSNEVRCGSLSFLPFRFQEPDPLVDVGINRMIRLGKITRRKQGPANMLHVVVADGVRKNR